MNVVKDLKKDIPQWTIGVASIIGTREYQQDYVYCCSCDNGLLGVVCDGNGRSGRRGACQQHRSRSPGRGNLPAETSGCLSRSF